MAVLTLFGFHLPLPAIVLGALGGITYGLLAVGLVLIYRTCRIINFAQGQMGIFGVAVMGLLHSRYHFPFYLALVPSLAAGGAAGGITEVFVVRRLSRAPRIMTVVGTLGAGAFLSAFALALYPGTNNASSLPTPIGMPTVKVGALLINQSYMAMLIFGPIAVVALTLFLRHSRFGLGIRASSANPEAARMAGVSVNNMSNLAWVLAGGLSALTAILVIPASGFSSATTFGPELLLRALAAAVIARMYSLPVAFASGIAMGVVEQLVIYNYPQSDVSDVVIYGIIIVALVVQRAARSREGEKGTWAAVSSWPPLSAAVARLPEVRALRWGLTAGALAIAVVLPLLLSNSSAVVLSTILVFSVVGLSVSVLAGLSGQLSLGQFAIAGAGAVVALQVEERAPFFVALIAAAGAGAALSVIIGAPAIRLRGLMLAVTTLGFALVAGNWALSESWALGQGITPHSLVLFGRNLDSGRSYYFVVLAVFLVALLLVWNVRRRSLGRALLAVRDNEEYARAFTISVRRRKLQAFVIAGGIAGLGGAVYAHLLSNVDPGAFPVQSSIDVVAMVVIGGVSVLTGPLIGALYIIGLPGFVPLDSAGIAASQVGWLILILYLPGGISQAIEPLRNRYIRWAASRHGVDLRVDQRQPGVARPRSLAVVNKGRRPVSIETAPLLEARHLSKAYGGVVAVDDVSLSIARGETLGLIGPNGAGKTTTFELLSGFTRPDSGNVVFEGNDISRLGPERRGRLGLIRSFQDAALFPTLTVTDTLRLAFEPHLPTSFIRSVIGLPGNEKERRGRADDLIELMGLDAYRTAQTQELSTGTRRIVELACMVALSPTLVLLDEPSSGVAQRETEALALLLDRLKRELGLTILIIEHDIPLVMGVSNRIIAMETGRVIADGSPQEMRNDPLVIDAYLGTNVATINRSMADQGGPSPFSSAIANDSFSHTKLNVKPN